MTSDYLTADFSSSSGWTLKSGGGSEHNEGFGRIGTLNLNSKASTTDATHLSTEYCCGFSARWNGRYTYYQQTASGLPIGQWTVKYDVQDVNSTSTKNNMDNHFYVMVGETKYSDVLTEWMNAGKSDWTEHSISFTLVEASDITLSLGYGNKENKGSNDCPAIYVSHLKLLYSNINGPLLAALIAQAQSLGVASDVISAAQTTYNDIDNTPAYQTTALCL